MSEPAIVPSTPDPMELAYREAVLLHRRGFLRGAERAFRKLLEQSPNNFQLLANLGWVFQDRARWSEAEQLYRQSLGENPEQAWVHNHLGMVLLQQGRGTEALAAVNESLNIKPDFGLAWLTLGRIQESLQQKAEAADAFAEALKWLPDSLDAALGLGSVLRGLGRYAEACAAFDQALVMDGNHASAWVGRAFAREALGDHSLALEDFNRALELNPDHAAAHAGMGLSLLSLGRIDEAWAASKRALALDEASAVAWVVRGVVQRRNGQLQEALAALSKALSLEPRQPLALWQSAHIKLLLGEFEQGWAASLWAAKAEAELTGGIPFVAGPEYLADRALLITHVETSAQVLQYGRFLPLLADQAKSVTLRVPDDCLAMARWALPTSISVVTGGDSYDECCDRQLPLMAVPAFLGLQQPVPPLLPAQGSSTWDKPLQGESPRVGVYWGMEPTEWGADESALPLSALRSLLELPHTFHLLKSPLTDEERALVADLPNVVLHEGGLETPQAMAGLLDQCDLAICPDSTVAHMAATMGKQTWVMLPTASAHAWLRDGSDSPWYPSVTLYRKPDGTDWGVALRRIKKQLPFHLHVAQSESEARRFVPDLTYDLSQYDEHGCLQLSGPQKLIMLFLGRGFWLPMFASFVASKGNKPGMDAPKGSMDFILHGSKHPLLELACALPVVLLVLVLFKRKPESGRLLRRLWAWGPWLLLLSAVADFTLRLVTVRWGGDLGLAPFWMLMDAAIALHIFNSSRLRDVFKHFPTPQQAVE